MRSVSDPGISYDDYVVPVSLGGTGSNDLSVAAANLKLVRQSQIGQANGPMGLDALGQLDPAKFSGLPATNRVNVQGNFAVIISTTVQFVITDYDSFKSYTVSVSVGTVSRSGDTITYTAPGTAQVATLTINGRQMTINVNVPAPQQPVISAPTNGSTNQPTASLSVTASAFVPVGDSSTHTSSDWQLATDSGFTSVILQSLNDTTNKTTWSPSVTLNVNTTYYLRVRYKGSNGNFSSYSSTSSFTTKAIAEATVESAIVPSDYGSTSSIAFAQVISVSDDGLRIATIGARGNSTGYGQTGYWMRGYVFHKVNGTWTKVFTRDLDANTPNTGSMSGSSSYMYLNQLRISPDGNRLFGMDCCNGNGWTGGGNEMFMDGQVNVYTWNGSTYALETTLSNQSGTTRYQFFGAMLGMNQDATRVMICAPTKGTGSINAELQYWTRSGTSWTARGISGSRRYIGSFYGFNSISMSTDGTRFVVTYWNPNGNNASTTSVWASVYTVTGTTFAFEQDISITIGTGNQTPGRNVSMNGDGSVIAMSSGSTNNNSDINALSAYTGSVFVFTRSGTTWSQQQRIINDDVTVNENFGFEVKLNTAGDKMLVSAYSLNYNSQSNRGAYYLFTRTGGVWSRSTIVSGSTVGANSFFSGYLGANSSLTVAVASGRPTTALPSWQAMYVFN